MQRSGIRIALAVFGLCAAVAAIALGTEGRSASAATQAVAARANDTHLRAAAVLTAPDAQGQLPAQATATATSGSAATNNAGLAILLVVVVVIVLAAFFFAMQRRRGVGPPPM